VIYRRKNNVMGTEGYLKHLLALILVPSNKLSGDLPEEEQRDGNGRLTQTLVGLEQQRSATLVFEGDTPSAKWM
jgi:hypothetical protein